MTPELPWERRLGATPLPDGRVEFRVWAPPRADGEDGVPSAEAEAHDAVPGAADGTRRVELELRGERHALAHEGFGVWSIALPAAHGDDYRFVLDGGEPLPDPCTRWQPGGLRGPSRVVDPARLAPGAAAGWGGLALDGLVLYELHVGTFTDEGTFDAAIPYLEGLAELGVTAVEVMPIAEFPGQRGWGYDGVYLSAAQSSYGGPEGFARFVEAAHAAGLGVVLDVVYNHLGASGGRAMEAFGPYFTDKHETFWGSAINFDDERCDPVREWVLQSAEGWLRDFGVDGLRLDAIHAISDESARPIVGEICARAHAVRPGTIVIAESGLNDPRVIRPPELGGLGCDAQWADDFHHALRVLLTGEREGYYSDFGQLSQLAKVLRRPFLHDGDYSPMRRRRFGAPAADRPPQQFVVFTANHDQVGNRAFGDRLPRSARPLAAFCVLLSPFTPMLFMGEEYGEDAPFLFFSDHIDEEIAVATREGRRREFAEFAAFAGEEVPDPQDRATFASSKLTRRVDPHLAELYRDLLRTRRELGQSDVEEVEVDPHTGCLRVLRAGHVLAANFGAAPATVPVEGGELVLCTHDGVTVRDGSVELPALAGALVRR